MISPAEKFQLEAERDEWKLKAEKAERERDEAREQRNQAQMTWDDEHDAKLKAEAALGAQTVALASSQAREQELRMAIQKAIDDSPRAAQERMTRVVRALASTDADTSALRELMIRAVESAEPYYNPAQAAELVDAVLGAPTSLERK